MKLLSTQGTVRQEGRAWHQDGVSLIELLIAMSIMAVISMMIIMGWSAATRSYAYSRNSAEARDVARQGLSRMTREIRDAEMPSDAYFDDTTASTSIVRSDRMWMALFTTFNRAGSPTDVAPRLVVYYLYADGQLWRYADLDGNGQNGSVGSWANAINDLDSTTTVLGVTDLARESAQTTTWEGRQKVVDHVVNWTNPDPNVSASLFTDVFRYSLWRPFKNTAGVQSAELKQESPVGDQDRAGIVSVQIHLLVDLNPAHSPAYIDLMTTAQLRNQRQF
jgi:prepilin-type N-terminal cleavage/methylation domain-containing protein